jgi:uncharacterized protein (DUF1778 family)
VPVEDNSRISLRIPPAEKALLMRAVTLQRTSLTDFVIRTVVAAAREIIDEAERLQLSERDTLRALEFLENPPLPNERLRAAARALPGPA